MFWKNRKSVLRLLCLLLIYTLKSELNIHTFFNTCFRVIIEYYTERIKQILFQCSPIYFVFLSCDVLSEELTVCACVGVAGCGSLCASLFWEILRLYTPLLYCSRNAKGCLLHVGPSTFSKLWLPYNKQQGLDSRQCYSEPSWAYPCEVVSNTERRKCKILRIWIISSAQTGENARGQCSDNMMN